MMKYDDLSSKSNQSKKAIKPRIKLTVNILGAPIVCKKLDSGIIILGLGYNFYFI